MPRVTPNFLTSSIELFKNLNIDFKNDDWGKETMIRKINVLSGEVLRTRKKVAEAESNVFKANTESTMLKQEKEQLQEEMLSLKAKYSVVDEALANARSKIRSLNEKFATKERELMSTKDELSRQNAATEELRSNLEFTQKHLANGDNNLQRLETQNSRLKSKINQLMRENAKRRSSVEISSKFEEAIQLYDRKLTNLKLSLEKEIAAREVRLSCAFEKLKQLARWTQKCGSELRKRVERECALKKRILALETAADEQQSSATLSTQATIKSQMRKIKQLVQQKQELERKLQQSDLKITSMTMSSNYQINTIRESFEEGLKQFKAQCEKFRLDMEATRTELNNERAISNRLRSELDLEKRDSKRLLERIENMGRLRQYFLSLQQTDMPGCSQPLTGVSLSGANRSNHKEKKAECYNETQGSDEGTPRSNKNALYERLGHLIKKMEHNLT